jgi:hypothetical protein
MACFTGHRGFIGISSEIQGNHIFQHLIGIRVGFWYGFGMKRPSDFREGRLEGPN